MKHQAELIFSQHPEEHMIPEEISGWVSCRWHSASMAIGFHLPFETKRRVLGIKLGLGADSRHVRSRLSSME